MKQLFFAAITTAFVLAGCATPEKKSEEQTASNSAAEKNLANARTVAKAFSSGNAAGIDSVIADDFVDHTDRGDKIGRDSLKAMINWVKDHGKDMKMEAIREVGDDEYVFQWLRYTGTSDGAMGPAGPYDMKVIEVSRHKDGKIVEHWAYMDSGEMMKMMAAMGAPAPAPDNKMKADSGKAKP